ncbi:MAG: trigger factor, partial [Egibacteraceae bacterium]
RVDDTTVKLSVTVEAKRVGEAIDSAARKLAGEVRVPGFRPGHVPRRVLESRLGKATLLQQAARDALPSFYAEAARAEDLEVVASPELDVGTFEDGKDAEFSATVEVRPTFDVPDYAGLQVPHPDWEVTEAEVGEQLEALRERFAEVETVQRPLQAGDYAVVTITAERDGERLEAASAEDLLYAVPDEAGDSDSALDRELLGASAGAILKFSDALGADYGEELAGVEAAFTAIVKEVKAKRLPDLDDDFAITASEYDTIDELRGELRAQLGQQKLAHARSSLRGRVVEAVCELVEVPLPQSMVDTEVHLRLGRVAQEAERHGMNLEQYLAAAGTNAEKAVSDLEGDARKTVAAQLVVDAVGREAGVNVTQEDLGGEIARQALRLGRPPEELAKVMTAPDRIGALVSDAFRRKAIDHLVASVEVLGGPPESGPDEPGPQAGEPEGASDQNDAVNDEEDAEPRRRA